MSGSPASSHDLAERTRRAANAALEAGRALGLAADRATVLHDAFSVVVHLEPAPVVARVQVVLAPGITPQAQAERQQRELDVVAWLAGRGMPVVAPAPLVPHAPVRRDGFAMTFWELADVAADHVPYAPVPLTHSADLHAALAEYPQHLPFLTPFNRSLAAMLAGLDDCELLSAADVARARAEYAVLRSVLCDRAAFLARFPEVGVQAIHGDGPAHNVIRTTQGLRFSDFEDVTCGPVEWDLALADQTALIEYDEAARAHGLRTTNPDVQRVVNAAAMLQMVSVLVLVPQLPLLADGVGPMVETWRSTPSLA